MKKIRVLLVDDSPAFLRAAAALLATVPDIECVAAVASAEAALQEIQTFLPDLVLMDFMMPGMNGIEATREISIRPGAPRVVLVTLHEGAEYRRAALENGAAGVISKKDFATEIPELIAQMAGSDAAPLQAMEMRQ